MEIKEYIKQNPCKIKFHLMILFISVLGLIEIFGASFGIPASTIGLATILGAGLADITGINWKDHWKHLFNNESKSNNDNKQNKEDEKTIDNENDGIA